MWPTEHDFRLVVQQEGETPGGYYYASNRLEMAEHGGTHIDAPIHFSRGGQTLDQIPIERLLGGRHPDRRSGSMRPRSGLPHHDPDFEQWEATHERIPNQVIVLVDTGFAPILAVTARAIWEQS